jgi:hypothetical protein
MRIVVALALCAACGSVDNSKVDASLDDSGNIDSLTDAEYLPDAYAATCAASTFTTFSPVSQLNSAGDDTFLRLSADELTAYLTRGSATYFATRGSTSSPFGTPIAMTNGADQESPTVTADGLTLYFVSARTGTMGSRDVWKATRATTSADFGTAVNVTELNSATDEMDVYVLPDGSAIYVSSARTGGVYEVYRATRNGTGWNALTLVFSRSPSYVNRVVVAPNERTLVYQIGNDVWLTTRATRAEDWTNGTSLAMLNTANADNPTWLSSDLCRLYFQSNGPGTTGLDFRVAVRTPQ